jgi:AraC-like DNA-binding protein
MHEYHASNDEPWEYFWIMFSPETSKKFFLPFISIGDTGIFNYSFLDQLQRFCKKVEKADTPLNHHEALSFFMTLISFHESHTDSDLAPKRHIRAAKTYIESNCNRRIMVSDVAEAVHLNERYLYNIFVKHEGTTPKQYIDAVKIANANEMLSQTNASIGEIAKHCGFDDVCAFSKFFSANTGRSPSAYRTQSIIKIKK